MSYTPPQNNTIQFGKTKIEPEKKEKPSFYFDPKRPEKERMALIATDGEKDPQGGPIKFWSFSSLMQFQECPYRLYLRRVKKIAEPSSEAGDRGTKLHDHAESYVRSEVDTLPPAKKIEDFRTRFEGLQTLYNQGQVELEQNWGFDVDWGVIPDDGRLYRNDKLWCITKLDAFVREDETSARVIDHKTGRKYGNEVKHGAQAQSYAISAFMRYPELQFITTEFWYLDQGQETLLNYTRADAMLLLPRLTERAIKLTSATRFPAKPSANACKFCHYRLDGSCEFGEAI